MLKLEGENILIYYCISILTFFFSFCFLFFIKKILFLNFDENSVENKKYKSLKHITQKKIIYLLYINVHVLLLLQICHILKSYQMWVPYTYLCIIIKIMLTMVSFPHISCLFQIRIIGIILTYFINIVKKNITSSIICLYYTYL
jgi:hypothetical protein